MNKNINVAILLPGHIRSYNKVHSNIKEKLLDVLEENGYNYYIFTSLWSTSGFRENNWSGNIDTKMIQEHSTCIEIENDKRSEFIEKYSSNDKWKKYSHLSGKETLPDSVGMWYKIQKCLNLMEKYEFETNTKFEFVFRIRPDIFFKNDFNIDWINTRKNSVYMAEWHKKHEIVTHTIMDHFGFGDYDSMKIYCSVFNNLDNILERNDTSFTPEGLLCSQLQYYNIKIERIPIQYFIKRLYNLEKITF